MKVHEIDRILYNARYTCRWECLYVTVKRVCRLPLRFQSINCHITENATRHITKQYDYSKEIRPAPQEPSADQLASHSNMSTSKDSQMTGSHASVPRQSVRRSSVRRRSSNFQSSESYLVLRRGQKFTVELAFDRPYDRQDDDIVFTFQFGKTLIAVLSLHSCPQNSSKLDKLLTKVGLPVCDNVHTQVYLVCYVFVTIEVLRDIRAKAHRSS